jgi:DNA-binding transcriptional regulator YiaG
VTQTTDAAEIARVREWVRSGRAKAIRERAHVSQAEVAETIGVDPATVSRWEAGGRVPRGAVAERLGKLLRELSEVAP